MHRCVTNGSDLMQVSQHKSSEEKQKKPEIQDQMLMFDKISAVFWQITYIGIMLLQGRTSMFGRTIFRYR